MDIVGVTLQLESNDGNKLNGVKDSPLHLILKHHCPICGKSGSLVVLPTQGPSQMANAEAQDFSVAIIHTAVDI